MRLPSPSVRVGHLTRGLAALALMLALVACQAGGSEGSPQPDPDVATFGTAAFDNAQFE